MPRKNTRQGLPKKRVYFKLDGSRGEVGHPGWEF